MLRSLLLEKVAPKQFHDKEMEGLRTFYPGDMGEDMLERIQAESLRRSRGNFLSFTSLGRKL